MAGKAARRKRKTMASPRGKGGRADEREGRSGSAGRPKKGKPRAFRLDAERLAEARRVLGTPNDTATLDVALDLVVFRNELAKGIDRLADKEIASPDDAEGAPLSWRRRA
jgi:hypothetical protein